MGQFANMLGTDLYTIGMNGLNSFAQGYINEYFIDRARPKNFEWSQKEAEAADKRQRAQYNDLYSPQAMLDQYAAAGLSPSMMMSGGQSAVGGTPQGNMGNSLSGAYPTAGAMSLAKTAGLENELIKAQIRNLDQDTTTKELENEIKKLNNSTLTNKWKLLNITTGGDENGIITISDLANSSTDFEDFKKKALQTWKDDPEMNIYINSEEGKKELRAIYQANKEFGNDIAVLNTSMENADIMLKIAKLLNNQEFVNGSATAQKLALERQIESSKLTAREHEAFNNILNKIDYENSDYTDLLIVLVMTLGSWTHANISTNTNQLMDQLIKD